MAKGITYFCTDQFGHTYSRYSVRHNKPVYPFAVARRFKGFEGPLGKSAVTYHSRAELAAREAQAYQYGTAEILQTRAYPGNHKTEPQA